MSKSGKDSAVEVPEKLLRVLLTDSELRLLKQRYLIIRLRQQNLSIRSISGKLGVGTDTVVRVLKQARSNRLIPPVNASSADASSKWVFGQVRGEEE